MTSCAGKSRAMTCAVMFVVVILACCDLSVSGDPTSEDEQLIVKLLDSVRRAVNFYAKDYADLNADGLGGLRMGQGQLIQALQECASSATCPKELQKELQDLIDESERVYDIAEDYVKAQDPVYFERVFWLMAHPYRVKYVPTTLTNLDQTPIGTNPVFEGEASDMCLGRVSGTLTVDGKKVNQCNVTEICWDVETEPGRAQYSITHQILFLSLVEMLPGCAEKVEARYGGKVREVMDRMCGSVYNEVKSEIYKGDVFSANQDLFLEQVLFCGSLGYENFLRRDWMKMVLRWQMASGCFTIPDQELLSLWHTVEDLQQQTALLYSAVSMRYQQLKEEFYRGSRSLLTEKVMSDGCLSHMSALGFGTVCLSLRYLIRQNYLPE